MNLAVRYVEMEENSAAFIYSRRIPPLAEGTANRGNYNRTMLVVYVDILSVKDFTFTCFRLLKSIHKHLVQHTGMEHPTP